MKLKNWQKASTEDRKRKKSSFFTKQKPGPVRTYSYQNTKFSNRESTKRWSISRYLGYHFRKESQTTLLHGILATLQFSDFS